VRLLLEISRTQTAQFSQDFQLPIWEDSTNQDLKYKRNYELKIISLATKIISSGLSLGNSQAFAETMQVGNKEYPMMDSNSMVINVDPQTVGSDTVREAQETPRIFKPCDRVSTDDRYKCMAESSGAT
jgi:tRNA(Ile)-lysidine synthase TilS/MesJ